MVRGASGVLAAGSQDEVFYDNEVTLLRAKAELACTERAAAIQVEQGTTLDFDDPQAISCGDAVADETPYYSTECVLDEDICPPMPDGGGGFGTGGGDGGTGTSGDGTTSGGTLDGTTSDPTSDTESSSTGPGAGGPMLHGLDGWDEVLCCESPGHCEVALSFVDDLLQDLDVLTEDAIAVDTKVSEVGHFGFVFTHVGDASLPAALGIEPGDVLWQVEGVELRSLADVGRAFEELSQARSLAVAVDRGAHTVVLEVQLVDELSQ